MVLFGCETACLCGSTLIVSASLAADELLPPRDGVHVVCLKRVALTLEQHVCAAVCGFACAFTGRDLQTGLRPHLCKVQPVRREWSCECVSHVTAVGAARLLLPPGAHQRPHTTTHIAHAEKDVE